jgi:hypothetical protein
MIIVLFFLSSFFQAATHPLHVSVAEIEYIKTEHTCEIMMRIFVEDLESAIRTDKKMEYLDLLHPSTGLTTKELIGSYLNDNFTISLDGKKQSVQYLGQELDGEAVICYLIVSNVKEWKSIEVYNNVLINIFDDQSNLVHVIIGDDVKSMRLVKDKNSGKLTFDPN